MHLYLLIVFVTLIVQPVAMATTFDSNTNREVTITTPENVKLNSDQNNRFEPNAASNGNTANLQSKASYGGSNLQETGLSTFAEPYNPLGHITNGQSPQEQLDLGWEEISTNNLGLVNPIPSMDLDGDNLPEIFTTGQVDGTIQGRGEAGFTKILEYDPTSKNFTTEIYHEDTPTPYYYYPYDPFGNNSIYFIRDVYNILSSSDQVTVVKWDPATKDLLTVSNPVTFEDWAYFYNQYDFDGDNLKEIFAISGENNLFSRLEISPTGVLTKEVYGPSGFSQGILIEDLDGDNEIEVAIVSISTGLYIFEYNSGSNNFTQSFNVDLGNNHQELWAWDYDNDGLLNTFVTRELSTGSDLEVVNYEWDGISAYVLDSKSIALTGLKFSSGQIRPHLDVLNNGGQSSIVEGERGSGSGINEVGYISYNGVDFEFNLISSISNSNQLYVNALQIDNDPTSEFAITYTNTGDLKQYSRIVNKESDFSHLAYYENFNDDVFASTSWTKSAGGFYVDQSQGKLIAPAGASSDGTIDYTNLPADWKIIEVGSRGGHPAYKLPTLRLLDDANTYLVSVAYHDDDISPQFTGWRFQEAWTNNFKGPHVPLTWYDTRLIREGSNVALYAKPVDSQHWQYIAEAPFSGLATKVRLWQSQSYLTEWDYLKIYTNGSTQGPTERDSYVEFVESQNKIYWFGGLLGSTYYDEMWVYDVPTSLWTNITTVVRPTARYAHDMVYDEESERIIMFGGNNGANLGDTWSFNVNTYNWTIMNPAVAPSARGWFGLGYDNINDVIILHGGSGSSGETWAYDYNSNTWTNMNPVTSPTRTQHRIIFDESVGKFIMFGDASYTETWSYDYSNNAWLNLNPTNNPSARNQGQLWYDSRTQNILLYSGYAGVTRMNDTWVYNSKINNWRQLAPRFSTMRTTLSNGIVYIKGLNRALMFYPYFDETGVNEETVYSFDFDQNTWFGNVTDLAGVDSVYEYIINDHFDKDLTTTGWTTSDGSVSTDTSYGIARISSDGGNDDYFQQSITTLQTPLVIEYRSKLVSGGANYRLPWVFMFYSNGSRLDVGYANAVGTYWSFNGWTGINTNGVPGENVWYDIRAVYTNTNAILFARSPTQTDYQLILTKSFDGDLTVQNIEFRQPWDSPNEIDYLRIYNEVDPIIPVPSDTNSPIIDTPLDVTYEEDGSASITWAVGDVNPDTYNITRNAILVNSGIWVNGTITIDVSGLLVGVYTYIITVYDASGNSSSDNVILTVIDTVPPSLDSSTDATYELGSSSNFIVWTVGDRHPGNYRVDVDGVQIIGLTAWVNGTISIPVDTSAPGVYSYVIFVYDLSDNMVSDTVSMTIEDTVSPVITSPPDINYYESATGNSISWDLTESNPTTYTIYQNGTVVVAATAYVNGATVSYNVDGLSIGAYNLTIQAFDGSGNWFTDTVIVTVLDDVDDPVIVSNPPNSSYELGTTTHVLSWTVTDANAGTYVLYLESAIDITSTAWISGTAINYNAGGYGIGVHNVSIIFSDTFGNSILHSVFITVIDSTAPLVTGPTDLSYAENTLGNSLSWDLSDLDPDTYIIYLDSVESVSATAYSSGGTIFYNVA